MLFGANRIFLVTLHPYRAVDAGAEATYQKTMSFSIPAKSYATEQVTHTSQLFKGLVTTLLFYLDRC